MVQILQCAAVKQCSSVQGCAVICRSMQCSAVQCTALEGSAVKCSEVQCSWSQCMTQPCTSVKVEEAESSGVQEYCKTFINMVYILSNYNYFSKIILDRVVSLFTL